MSISEEKLKYSFRQYLALEEKAEYKSEFYQGEIFSMSGGTGDHSLIASNLIREVGIALKGKACNMYNGDFRVRIENADSGVYPDGMVICGPREYYKDRKDVVTNPTVVFEVLSESTAAWDYGGKFRKYQQLPSLREYVLVEQKEPQVVVFRKNPEGEWLVQSYGGLDAMVELKSLGVEVASREIYDDIAFE